MGCYGCEIKETAQQMNVDELIAEQLSFERHLASAKVVEERVKICTACPFRSMHTCTKCGCFYKFRASLADKSCPAQYWQQLSQ